MELLSYTYIVYKFLSILTAVKALSLGHRIVHTANLKTNIEYWSYYRIQVTFIHSHYVVGHVAIIFIPSFHGLH